MRLFILAFWASLALVAATVAQDDAKTAAFARIPMRIVGDKPVVRCELASATKRIPVTLVIELENPIGLAIHARAMQGLEASDGDPVTIHFPGEKIKDVPVQSMGGDLPKVYEDFTKYWSTDLGDIPCVGSLGFGVLGQFHLTLDFGQGELRLAPPREKTNAAPDDPEGRVTAIEMRNDAVWFPIELDGKKPAMALLATATYDTIIESTVANAAGHPAGDIGPVLVNRIDFSPYAAFRPGSVPKSHPDGGFFSVGAGLLKSFRVELDFVNMRASFTPIGPPAFPVEDRKYFEALVSKKADPIESFLVAYPKVRLSREAAETLVERRIDEGAEPPAAVERAIDWVEKTTFEDRRATRALDLMDRFQEFQMTRFVVYAGEKGIAEGRTDRDPTAVHKIHGRLGEILTEEGKDDDAWRHLLSAAFGLKDDGAINLNLGRLYEKKKKLNRAFSRYVQAVIKPESAAKALEALDRVQKAMGGTDHMSIDAIERLIEGRVPGYRSATQFKATPKTFGGRTALAQLFVSSEIRDRNAADLAFDALASYFPRENVCVLAYHLPMGGLDGLTSKYAMETAEAAEVGQPCLVINGNRPINGTHQEEMKQKFFEEYKKQMLEELLKTAPLTLELDAQTDGKEVFGTVTLKGPAATGLTLEVVLAEKGVLFPSKNVIAVHHWVVRGTLCPNQTVRADPTPEGTKKTFRRSLQSVMDELDTDLESFEEQSGASLMLRPTKIDARMLSVVAFVKGPDGEVLQAVQKDCVMPEEK